MAIAKLRYLEQDEKEQFLYLGQKHLTICSKKDMHT